MGRHMWTRAYPRRPVDIAGCLSARVAKDTIRPVVERHAASARTAGPRLRTVGTMSVRRRSTKRLRGLRWYFILSAAIWWALYIAKPAVLSLALAIGWSLLVAISLIRLQAIGVARNLEKDDGVPPA
jgi:hypothetical protein